MLDRLGAPELDQFGREKDDTSRDRAGSAGAMDETVNYPGNVQGASAVNTLAVDLHRSLNPKEVTTVAVQELRPILSCDRVCYLERRGKRFRLCAVSGHPGRPPRSRQSSLLEQLVAAVLVRGERFVYPEDQLTLPENLARQLATYWENAGGQMILVEPVFSCLPNSNDATPRPVRRVVGALAIEQFSDSELKPGTINRLDAVIEHLTPALANARRYSRLVRIPGLYLTGLLFEGMRRSRILAMLMSLIVIASILSCAWTITSPLEIECHGRLMPVVRREVFAVLEGEVTEVMVNESERVEEGQIIARMRSRDLDKAILEQTGLLKGKLKAQDAARAELRGQVAPQARGQSSRDQAQLEVINAELHTIHRQLELLDQQREQLIIRAPISGTVTTERLREKLLQRPVLRGESLLEIMDETGAWELELAVAEKKIGHLLSYQRQANATNVKFRLHSEAKQSFDCTVTRVADRMLPSVELGACSLVFCNVSQLDLPTRQIGSGASARIQCGKKSLLFIWFHEFWELLQRNWWV